MYNLFVEKPGAKIFFNQSKQINNAIYNFTFGFANLIELHRMHGTQIHNFNASLDLFLRDEKKKRETSNLMVTQLEIAQT